jgi:hypothetical protein
MKDAQVPKPSLTTPQLMAGRLLHFLSVGLGPLKRLIKNLPIEDPVSINVSIDTIEIHEIDTSRWISLLTMDYDPMNFSVMGEIQRICEAKVPPGHYNIIRLHINYLEYHYEDCAFYHIEEIKNHERGSKFSIEIPLNFIYTELENRILFDVGLNYDFELELSICMPIM